MSVADNGWFTELLIERTPPCISIYQPLYRNAPPAHENPVRFRNLAKRAEELLAKGYPQVDRRRMIRELIDRVDHHEFWTGPRDGLAVFHAPGYFRMAELQQQVDELVTVADSFHIKPLIRILQSADRYHVLCFALRDVRLYEGSRHGLREMELQNVPRDINRAVGLVHRQPGTPARNRAAGPAPTTDGETGFAAISIEHFIRAVDEAIWEQISRRTPLPLILVCDGQYHDLWRRISRNRMLLKDRMVGLVPSHVPIDRLKQEAWRAYEPIYNRRLHGLIDQFKVARAHRTGSDQIAEVAQAAADGRVGSLLVAENARIPGRLDRAHGRIEQASAVGPDADDVVDELAEMVLRMDGQVIALPPEQMPTEAGIAAIYRY